MKTVVVLILFGTLGVAATAEARQDRPLDDARGRHVAVIDADKREWQGRLIDVGKDALILELDSTAREFPIESVRRVDVEGDRVIDGVIKGAIFGGVLGAVFNPRSRGVFAAAMVYGFIGAGIDALNTCHHTVYRAPAAAASVKVSW